MAHYCLDPTAQNISHWHNRHNWKNLTAVVVRNHLILSYNPLAKHRYMLSWFNKRTGQCKPLAASMQIFIEAETEHRFIKVTSKTLERTDLKWFLEHTCPPYQKLADALFAYRFGKYSP